MTQFKNTFLSLSIVTIALVFTSCGAEELASPRAEFSEKEMMTMLQSDIISSNNGMIYDIQQFVEELVKIIDQEAYCNQPYEFYIEDGSANGLFETSYSGQVNGEVTCFANLPVAATFYATSSSRLIPLVSGEDFLTGAASFKGNVAAFFNPLSFFPPELETGVEISGQYSRVGSAINNEATAGPQKITTNLNIELTEFRATVLPEAIIEAGIGTLTFTGTVDGEQVFDWDGRLVFNGDKTLTLTINGEEFPWSWE